MKRLIHILSLIVLGLFSTGFYYQYIKHNSIYPKLMGTGVLVLVFVLMPVFLYYRYKDKNLDDYKFKGFNNHSNDDSDK